MSITVSRIKAKGGREVNRFRYEFCRVIDGQRIRIGKLLPANYTRRQADAYDAKHNAINHAQAEGVAPSDQQTVTIAACVKLYLQDVLPGLESKDNVRRELEILSRAFGDLPLKKVGEFSREYMKTAVQMCGRDELGNPIPKRDKKGNTIPLAPATIRNRLAYLHSAVEYCRTSDHAICVSENYGALIQYPTVNNYRTTTINYAGQLSTLLAACDHPKVKDPDEMRALILFCLYTGMRWASEVRKLPAQDGSSGELVLDKTKNGLPVAVPLHLKLVPLLQYLPFDKMDQRSYWRQWDAIRCAAGMPKLWLHDLRRSFASHLISNGMEPVVAMQLMNQSAGAAKRYQWLNNAAKKRGIASLPM